MGIEVYTRRSYNFSWKVSSDTRNFSGMLEYALIDIVKNKISNGIQDDLYVTLLASKVNDVIAIAITNNLAIINCFNRKDHEFYKEIPNDCFNALDSNTIQEICNRFKWQIKEHVKAYNHERVGFDNINNCQTPLISEEIRSHLNKLVDLTNLELANRHIIFDQYPPVPEKYKQK